MYNDLAGVASLRRVDGMVGTRGRIRRSAHHDYEVWLERLAPHAPIEQYWHNRTGEDNADAHLKRQVMGREVVVAVTNGRLDLGTWERIFYGEFDGRRRKRVLVKNIGE